MMSRNDKTLATTNVNNQPTTQSESPTSNEAVEDSDYTSSSGSSSEDDDTECEYQDDNEESQPRTTFHPDDKLRSRIEAFLPQIQQSNHDLEASGEANSRRLDDVDDRDGPYIEMDLSLGVLSERKNDDNKVQLQDGADDEINGSGAQPSTKIHVINAETDNKTSVTTRRKIEEL